MKEIENGRNRARTSKNLRDTQDIRNLMEAFKESMKDESFDTHFKKYIKMNQL